MKVNINVQRVAEYHESTVKPPQNHHDLSPNAIPSLLVFRLSNICCHLSYNLNLALIFLVNAMLKACLFVVTKPLGTKLEQSWSLLASLPMTANRSHALVKAVDQLFASSAKLDHVVDVCKGC